MNKHQDGHRGDNIATVACQCTCQAHAHDARDKRHGSALHKPLLWERHPCPQSTPTALAWRIGWACAIVLRCGALHYQLLSPAPRPITFPALTKKSWSLRLSIRVLTHTLVPASASSWASLLPYCRVAMFSCFVPRLGVFYCTIAS